MKRKQNSLEQQHSERGQAIVLLVLVITGLVAIVALAVDGGRAYYGQRTAQNAADNASLAGALALCTEGNVSSTALASAAANGFNNDGSSNTVTVNNPPTQGPNSGDGDYVEVFITSTQEAALAQIVFSGPLQSTVRSVGHCDPGAGGIGDGNGLISLDEDANQAVKNTGGGNITVNGGGIFVNSNDFTKALFLSGNGNIQAEDMISVVGGFTDSGNGFIDPAPVTGVPQMSDPLAALDAPSSPGGSCIDFQHSGSGDVTIDPGLYCQIKVTGSGDVSMNSGIYYIEGGEFAVTGNGSVDGSGVMIYIDEKEFKITGNGDVTISAPSSGSYAGVVLFMGRNNTKEIKLSGDGGLFSTGTIYGRDATLGLSGGGTSTVNSQVIVGKVEVSGNGGIEIIYDPDDNYGAGSSSLIELAE